MNDDSARPNFSVEEIPTPTPIESPPVPDPNPAPAGNPVVAQMPAPVSLASEVPSTEQSAYIETIPPIPHQQDSPTPESQERIVPPPPVPSAPAAPNGLPTGGHSVGGKGHHMPKLLFLIPAILLVATIFVVAKLTNNNFTSREPEPVITPTPTEVPQAVAPTPAPTSTKIYRNDAMLLQMSIPEEYEVLLEDDSFVSFGIGGTETFIARTDEFTNYDDEDDTSETSVGGRDAIKINLVDEGAVPIIVVQTLEEPKYEFVMYLDEVNMEDTLQKILDSVLFLVDTADWETFENTTYNYTLKHPPTWEENTQVDNSGVLAAKTEISLNPADKNLNNLIIQSNTNVDNAALTASEIISSTRTLSGWSSPPTIQLRKLGGGDAQIIQGELTGKWRAYVVIWYKNTVVQMIWEDGVEKPYQETFEQIINSFEFTT